MKNIVSLVAAFALLVAAPAFAAAPAGPTTLKAKNGDVTFNHKTHATVDCTKCHAAATGGHRERYGLPLHRPVVRVGDAHHEGLGQNGADGGALSVALHDHDLGGRTLTRQHDPAPAAAGGECRDG